MFVGALRCGRVRVRTVRIACWVVWRVLAVVRLRWSLSRHLAPPVACASLLRLVPRARATMSYCPIRAAQYRLRGPWQSVLCCCCYYCCLDLPSPSFLLLLVYCQVEAKRFGHRVIPVLGPSQIRRDEHLHSRTTSHFLKYE